MFAIELPWGAWYAETRHGLNLPGHWSVDVLTPRGSEALSPEAILQAIRSPIDALPLSELAKGRRTVCVVVDDLARPTPAADALPPLLGELHGAGVAPDDVRIVVATGSHGPLDERRLAWKVGRETLDRYRVECHDCLGPLAETDLDYGNRKLSINPTFYEADLKIAVGSVLPHSFAGYSGGAKLVLPGLADLAAIRRSHKFVQLGLRGGGDPNQNRFRLEAEDLARQLGLSFIVCVLTNQRREITGVYAGDVVAAHRRACAAAGQTFATDVNRTYDCLLLNAYPKDLDLIQAENAFVALKTAKSPLVRSGGLTVLMTAASEGLGRHGLFEPGGASYRKPRKKRGFDQDELWLYVPGVSADDVHKLYWDGYPVFGDARELTRALGQRFPGQTRAAILPCATAQQVHDLRDHPGVA